MSKYRRCTSAAAVSFKWLPGAVMPRTRQRQRAIQAAFPGHAIRTDPDGLRGGETAADDDTIQGFAPPHRAVAKTSCACLRHRAGR